MQHDQPAIDAMLRELKEYDYKQPRDAAGVEQHCDLVMKGGITSGVVYPLAVLKLARSRRFHSIGGTSAGAIAAAVTAAAEYGRAQNGFNALARLVEQLQERGFLANLFQPPPALRPLLQALFVGLKLKRRSKNQLDELPARMEIAGDSLRLAWSIVTAPKQTPAIIGGLAGLLLGLLIAGGWLAAAIGAGGGAAAIGAIWGVLLLALFWWLGTLAGTIAQLLGRALPGHLYGICDGMPVTDHAAHRLIAAQPAASPALTSWLAEQIDTIAGMPAGQPLTFGLLRLNHRPAVEREHKIELNMVTTNLSQGQPYIFPFSDTQFLFSKQEFERLFPSYIVDHLVAHADRSTQFATPVKLRDDQGQPHWLYFLPPPDQLPVIVGTRMSLSFPLLLSAVPLWTISASGLGGTAPIELRPEQMRRNWFSDGGICSNFPIHFYDRLFPTHPTFGINLDDLPQETRATPAGAAAPWYNPDFQWQRSDEFDPGDARAAAGAPDLGALRRDTGIYLPTSYPHDRPRPAWQPLDNSLGNFVSAIVNTGLFYRDIMQSRLPSYYDRIVTIFLNDQEGGMNLDMPPATIGRIAAKGYHAGEAIDSNFDFDHHRWVRLRLLLGKVEEQLIALREALQHGAPQAVPEQLKQQLAQLGTLLQTSGITQNAIQQLIDAELAAYDDPQARYPYPRNAAWRDEALTRLYLLLMLIEVWGGDPVAVFQLNDPRVPSGAVQDGDEHIRLRVTPDL